MATRAVLLALVLLAVALTGTSAQEGGPTVVVIKSASVGPYEEALRGFKAAFRHRVVAEQDLEGDVERGRKFIADVQAKMKPDLVFALGPWALQAVIGHAVTVPIVYAMVLNPPSIVGETKNVTGASMNVPVEQSMRLFKQLGPKVRRIGVVYSQAKTGYLVRRATTVAEAEGLQLVGKEIRTVKDAIPALDSVLDEGVDALWIVPDEAVLVPGVVQHMLLVSYRKKIPLVGLSDAHAQQGALLSLSFASSEDIGRQAGELAASIVQGKAPVEIPYTVARQLKLTVNLKAAQKLGVDVPKSLVDRANSVIR